MRLIDADAFLEEYKRYGTNSYPFVCEVVKQLPTIEAERHGRWIYTPKDAIEAMFSLPKCSVCGHESSDALNYCPNCGAHMKDEVGE